MSEADENTKDQCSAQARLCTAYIVRFCNGLVLIILSSVAAGYFNSEMSEEYGSVFPYYLGGYVTGISMALFDFFNYRILLNLYRRTATSKQKVQWVRSGAIISVISVIFALISSIFVGVNGIQAPRDCRQYYYNPRSAPCTESQYQQTNTYKIAISLLLMILLSILVNTIYMCQPDPFQTGQSKTNGNTSEGVLMGQRETLVQTSTNSHVPTTDNSSSGISQGRPDASAVLSTPDQQLISGHTYNSAINTRHEPETFAGYSDAIQSRRDQRPVNGHGSSNFTLNTRHGQPEPFAGAILSTENHGHISGGPSGFVFNTHHGQPQPFAGAIICTDTQPMVSLNNLVLELQEQNRLLREQLAVQQQQQQQQQQQRSEPTTQSIQPNAPVSDSPPSYESLRLGR